LKALVGVAEALVGRGRELKFVGSFLESAAVDGGALLLLGEVGVGKTVLLDAGAEMASGAGVRVLCAAGVEFEADVSFSGLNQALLPLYGEFERLSDLHRTALSVALGFRDGLPPDRLVLSTAALALLRQAADAQPLLVIVDDAHWLDRPSASVLGFIARRLAGSRVGLLAASRYATESFFGHRELLLYELQPLDHDAAAGLIDARFPALGYKARQRVLAEAQGNPLALVELSAAMSNTRFALSHVLPAVFPLGQRLQAVFAARVRGLPAATRQVLLLAALDGTGDLGVLLAARGGVGLDDLLPAERAELLRLDEGSRRVAFRHPLVRATVVGSCTDSERRQAHRALAEVLTDQPERRAWHLSEAIIESDEFVASLLEQAGQRALHRGDAAGAVSALIRAADLSPGGSDRSRRLAQAAYVGADVAGELGDVSQLLVDARNAAPDLDGSLEAAVATAYLILSEDGDIDTAHRLLVGAINMRGQCAASDNALIEALHTLFTVCIYGWRPGLWHAFDAALARLTPRPPALLSLCASLMRDPARATPGEIDQLEAVISRLHGEADPSAIVRIGRAALFVDRMSGCREAHWRIVRDGRTGGAVASAIYALINLCLEDYLVGEWDEAEQLADEGLQLCETHGYHLFAAGLWFGKARVAAGRGDWDTARKLTDMIDRWTAPRGAEGIRMCMRLVLAQAALGRGDFEEAFEQASRISPPGRFAGEIVIARWSLLDLVDAAVRTNRRTEAIAHSDAAREAGLAALSPRLALVSLGAAGIATPDEHAIEFFERALAIPEVERWPFDLARIHLAYGERLRRRRAIAEARAHLTAALEIFERLKARPWATRAGNELRATGLGEKHDLAALTPQELEIARLAATGLTNRQIGGRLFMSHRTVGAHLYRVFPKLGISSRAALRDALGTLPANPSYIREGLLRELWIIRPVRRSAFLRPGY
jgi:DNA-binding CsgD family transcriptional regulator